MTGGMMFKGTPGPWVLCAHLRDNDACGCGYRGVIFGPEPVGYAVCQPGHEPAPEGQEGTEPPRYSRDVEIANAQLLASVHDLLEALIAAKEVCDLAATMTSCRADDDFVWSAQAKINDAIAKALG